MIPFLQLLCNLFRRDDRSIRRASRIRCGTPDDRCRRRKFFCDLFRLSSTLF